MTYTQPPRSPAPAEVTNFVEYHDRVRWGPIIAGIVIAVSTQLVLSALGLAIGFTIGAGGADAGDVGLGVGIWSIISLFIALIIGGWVMGRSCGPMNRRTALLNGAILWATTIAVSAWLLASGVSGTFGILASNAGEVINQLGAGTLPNQVPNVNVDPQTAENYAEAAAKAGWSFLIGSLLGLAAALIGASAGAHKPRTTYVE